MAAAGEMASDAARAASNAALPGAGGVTDDTVADGVLLAVPVVVASPDPAAVVDDGVLTPVEDDPCPDALEFVAPGSWLEEVPVVGVSPDPVAVVEDVLPSVEDDAAEALLKVADSSEIT